MRNASGGRSKGSFIGGLLLAGFSCTLADDRNRAGEVSDVPDYEPTPIDTSQVVLPQDLVALTEKLAENAHDQWASKRYAEGWTWGEKRDDDAKTNPTLVPYDDLPDSEKEYDRATAMETVKAMLALGYRIELDSVERSAGKPRKGWLGWLFGR